MPGSVYNGAGSIFALGARITKLDPAGAPLVGENNCYVTEALISADIGNTYSEPDAIDLTNGQGQTCVHYQPTAVLLGGTLENFLFCTPDPYILQFLIGGNVIEDTTSTSATGYQAPAVNTDPVPDGVAIELFSKAVLDNSLLPGGLWWVLGRARLSPADAMSLGSADPLQPSFTGTLEQNPNFGDGPTGDIEFPTDRVWQFNYSQTIPVLSTGLVAVTADVS
jgi:hypothetical protein